MCRFIQIKNSYVKKFVPLVFEKLSLKVKKKVRLIIFLNLGMKMLTIEGIVLRLTLVVVKKTLNLFL